MGWRWIFLVNLPIGVLCAAATLATVPESRDPQPRRVDRAGQVLLTTGLLLLVLGLLRGNADRWSSPPIVAEHCSGRWCRPMSGSEPGRRRPSWMGSATRP